VQKVGSLPIEPGAQAGKWHRDVGVGLFHNLDLEMTLPDYYMTVIMPLFNSSVTLQTGTEVIIGSHRTNNDTEIKSLPHYVGQGQPGDMTVINAKVLHRGLPNNNPTPRHVLYMTLASPWLQLSRNRSEEFWTYDAGA